MDFNQLFSTLWQLFFGGPAGIVLVATILIVVKIVQYTRQANAIKAFANSHGYTYQASARLDGLDGVLFKSSFTMIPNYVRCFVEGNFNGQSFRLYNYDFSIKNNKEKIPNFDVLDTPVNNSQLRFLLLSNTQRTQLNKLSINMEHIKLEGDFDRYFTLYGPQGTEIEVLQVFTPDIMAYLIDHFQDCNIELTPHRLFLYRMNKHLSQAESGYETLVATATELSARLFGDIEKVIMTENTVTSAKDTH